MSKDTLLCIGQLPASSAWYVRYFALEILQFAWTDMQADCYV
jgi:hypothetical protein